MSGTGHWWQLGQFQQTLFHGLLTLFASCQARIVTEARDTLHPDR